MAWSCTAATNEGLVANLLKNDLVKTEAVAAAMRRVDRAWFLPNGREAAAVAYMDAPQPIGHNVTISAPHMHAIMLEVLAPYILSRPQAPSAPAAPPLRVLDVGSGSGYLTAVLAALCEMSGLARWQVVGLEHVPELQERSSDVLAKRFPAWAEAGTVQMVQGDGRDPAKSLAAVTPLAGAESGSGSNAPFDLIHVGAAAPSIPQPLVDLLRPGGCMVIPVGGEHSTQELLVCRKGENGKVTVKQDCLVRFVPLTSLQHQKSR